jgi:hypothetical protein
MNVSVKYILKILKKLYSISFTTHPEIGHYEQNAEKAAKIIYDILISDQPCMIARFGSTELTCLCNYIGVKNDKDKFIDYIKGEANQWWWDIKILNQMQEWSGFFPASVKKVEEFCELFLSDIPEVNILGSWLPQESLFDHKLINSYKVNFELLNPYFSDNPWTRALEGKKILVVHPFADTIEMQYKKRELLFEHNLLPAFELKTIKAVQSIAGTETPFTDWFEAFEHMKAQIDNTDYDICLIGCGAYGFSLAAHVKRMGKKGFHMGGSLQLLFGIRGKRWENENYNSTYNYAKLINEYWVKPNVDERPSKANIVEGACYW